jgi:hypothetical protein
LTIDEWKREAGKNIEQETRNKKQGMKKDWSEQRHPGVFH